MPFNYFQLSENFTLDEFTKSKTALELGIDNIPNSYANYNLKMLAIMVLQKVRNRFGPVKITSGYRSLELNRAIKSKDTSQHITGNAADFKVPGKSNLEVAQWIRQNLMFDQLLLEPSWIHVSYVQQGNRMECLKTLDGVNFHKW